VPYKNPERQRAAKRESARRRRRGTNGLDPVEPPLVSGPLRFGTAKDLLAVLEGQLVAVLADGSLGSAERARVVGYLITVGLRALEVRDMAGRIEALELHLKGRAA
jgi:hypothetical protein